MSDAVNEYEDLDPDHVEWTKKLLNSLKIGGQWAVPRSLLGVTRVEEGKCVIERLASDEEAGPPGFSKYQVLDTLEIERHIAAAGFEVSIGKNLMDDWIEYTGAKKRVSEFKPKGEWHIEPLTYDTITYDATSEAQTNGGDPLPTEGEGGDTPHPEDHTETSEDEHD